MDQQPIKSSATMVSGLSGGKGMQSSMNRRASTIIQSPERKGSIFNNSPSIMIGVGSQIANDDRVNAQ